MKKAAVYSLSLRTSAHTGVAIPRLNVNSLSYSPETKP